MKEKRRLSRKPFVGALNFFLRDLWRSAGDGFITNLNEKGMRIVSDKDLNPGDELSLHFRLPNNWKIDFLGTVVHKSDSPAAHAYGIKFREGQGTFCLRLF